MTRLIDRALDLAVDVAGWHTDRVGDLCARTASVLDAVVLELEDTASLLRFVATLTGACP